MNIYDIYINFIEVWNNSEYYTKFDTKSTLVKNLETNNLMSNIIKYREFLDKNLFEITKSLNNIELLKGDKLTNRVKNQNSIELKLYNYNNNITGDHVNGNVPVNKCFDDLFGIRIVTNRELEFSIMLDILKEELESHKLKCIDAIRGDYKAIHIYFLNGKYNFRWEVQIWNKENEEQNFISHKKYKQPYKIWEEQYKGGIL